MTKRAFITGITGQDGSYLAELLLSKGYEVHGLIRRASDFNTQRIDHIYSDPHSDATALFLHYGDLTESGHLTSLVYDIKPDEIYHLAAQSHVRISFDLPEYTAETAALGTVRILEAVRKSGIKTKFYQASSSELFGSTPPPQNESTPFHPRSPYAVAKLYGYWIAINYREAYKGFFANGILFNHESPRRGPTFVSRKITRGLAGIVTKKEQKLYMGNLEARRDWGFAPEYVDCMWRILQQDKPDDYVVGTGEDHSVKEFLVEAFGYVGLDYKKHVEIDPRYFRPTEVNVLRADISKAKKELKWVPKVDYKTLVKIMVDADLEAVGEKPPGEGFQALKKLGFDWSKITMPKLAHAIH